MSASRMGTIRWELDADGVALLTLDDPSQSANTMNAAYTGSMAAVVERLERERDSLSGVIVTSAKRTFFAGGDLNDFMRATPQEAGDLARWVREIKAQLRRLEQLGRPVVAAINGAALGGGLELALACHHRVLVDDAAAVVAFPEVTLGLMPGGGGVVRSVRTLGVAGALEEALLEGRRHSPMRAHELGLVDELVASPEALVPTARRWIAANPDAAQPWDTGGRRPPLPAELPSLSALLRKRLKGADYPAPRAILAAAVEGAQVDFEAAQEIELRYFLHLVTGQVAKNMMQAFFFDMQAVRGRAPKAAHTRRIDRVVVLGAGAMGAGMAYLCARAGIDVALKDVTMERAQRGKACSEHLLSRDGADRHLLDRIRPIDTPKAAAGADLVIEAVFEDLQVKHDAFAEIEPHLASDALLGTNTSTLPITELARAVSRPDAFVGLHFASPVERMPLLEVVRGQATSSETLDRALDLARKLRKTAIVVNDSPGFFTTRVIVRFLDEGLRMLNEGISPATIEQASAQAGYPTPLLALCDELSLSLIRRICAGLGQGNGQQVLDRMLDELARAGRLAGAGFYDYAEGKRIGLWRGLREVFPPVSDPAALPWGDLRERLLFAPALEAARCMEEGVIESAADANVGSILGIGFPGWTGGVAQYVTGYDGAAAGFAARAGELAVAYGERFEPPASLAG
jgi:3-hydroxyacyl-CoA dehydrogenase/enoyl-CoA hydratase/3-hydroxybutyryl-CoA epimerase